MTLVETGDSFTLANGFVTARIEKRTGNLVSLEYRGLELLGRGGRGYWSQARRRESVGAERDRRGAHRSREARRCARGGFIELRLRLAARTMPVDVDIRYALGRGEHWIYTYAVSDHRPGIPALFNVGEARYVLKLNHVVFDFMTIDKHRRRVMPTGEDWDNGTPTNLKEARLMTTGLDAGKVEHKYDYSAILAETPAYGWSSTRTNVGLWIVNPSMVNTSPAARRKWNSPAIST